jgi:protein-L-isoaspartate(D-aspartate) O-methyltransferase
MQFIANSSLLLLALRESWNNWTGERAARPVSVPQEKWSALQSTQGRCVHYPTIHYTLFFMRAMLELPLVFRQVCSALFRWRFFLLYVVFLSLSCGCPINGAGGEAQEGNFTALRVQMVEQQLRQRGIHDERVLQAMAEVPRHLFVPLSLRLHAYEDSPLPIGQEQTISQPYIVALMSQSLELTGTEVVLEVGTGSGYQAAVLSCLARRVYSIEILPELAGTAQSRLQALGYSNVTVIVGDGSQGWLAGAPYDAIIVTAAAQRIPPALLNQLAEGGRLVLPVELPDGQHLLRLRKWGGKVTREDLGMVQFVPLLGDRS